MLFQLVQQTPVDGEYPIKIPSFQPQGTQFVRICFAVSLIYPNVH